MAIDVQRLADIREGRRGIALGLYIDVDDDDWEDYSLSVPTVLALDKAAGLRLLDALSEALAAGLAQEVSDEASQAVSIILASTISDQVLAARMLESLTSQPEDALSWKLASAN